MGNLRGQFTDSFESLDNLRINQITIATIEKFIAELQNKPRSTAATRKPDFVPTGEEKKISLNTMRKLVFLAKFQTLFLPQQALSLCRFPYNAQNVCIPI